MELRVLRYFLAVAREVLFEMPTYQYLRTGGVIAPCMSFNKK